MNAFSGLSRRALLGAAAALPLAGWAQGPGYPNKPVSILVPYAPGGTTDFVARVAATYMAAVTKGTFLVDNRPGASGTIAMAYVAKAAPDGYTLYMTEMTSTAVGALFPKLSFDPDKSFVPIAILAETPYVLVVNEKVPAATLQEFMAYARANPGKLSYGSGGVGSGPHLAGELFKSLAKLDIRHVPYKGSGPALQDLLGGQIEMLITAAPTVASLAGKVKPLAVARASRLAILPALPTSAEGGLPDFVVSNWFGLSAPHGTPEAVIKTLSAAAAEAFQNPEALQKLGKGGADPLVMGADQARAKVESETAKWSALIRTAGIKNDN
ncbi:tripartite tricarboxylate transporter substrate binding protein [Xylophilus rhododendri]|uniref:Tripartite tricarboxylate transporter substrate binding protein n=1 Tax=Xylophilus rhododendri TaxID=2697032 RepID=A0A857J4H2_9BURK|nr:tripartite tricarboxylate transporter substrate binding protein [Xylophilus rhododendri]QHI98854.1 tripartite tricarboxylate transporter substrate binding protein [Xylophilus rhododendri]